MASGFRVADAYVNVTADTSGVRGAVQDGIGSQGGFFSGIGKVAGGVLAAGVIAGTAKIVSSGFKAVFATGLDEYKDADAANAQFAAGIKSTGGAAGLTVAHMNNLASSIQGYSGQTDDSIAQSENLLQTFTNIKNTPIAPIFDQATKATADMAARMGGDASKYAIQLGKALNDPVAGVSKLTKIGVTFNDQQKEQIKTMVAAGDTAGAQSVIIKELNKEFGGSAEAAGKSFPGTVARIQRGWEDLTQGIVGGLMPAVTPALGVIATLLGKLSGPIGTVAAQIGTKLTPVFESLGKKVQGLDFSKINFSGLITGFQSITQSSPLMLALTALAPLFPILGSVIVTLAPLIAQLATALSGALSGAIQALIPAVVALLPIIVQLVTQFGTAFLTALTALTPIIVLVAQILASLITFLAPFIPALVGVVAGFYALALVMGIVNAVMLLSPITWIIIGIVALIAIIVLLVTHWGQVVSFLSSVWGGFVNWLMAGLSALGAFWSSIWNNIVNFVKSVWNNIKSFISGAFTFIVAFIKAYLSIVLSIWTGVWNTVKSFVITIWNGIKSGISGAIGSVVAIVTSIRGKVVGAVSAAASWLVSTGRNVISGLTNGISGVLGTIGSMLGRIKGMVTGAISGAGNWLFGIGGNIISGLVRGIQSAAGAVTRVVQGMVNAIPLVVRKALGIASPSKVMRALGKWVGPGLALGIDDGSGAAQKAMNNLVSVPSKIASPQVLRSTGTASVTPITGAPSLRGMAEAGTHIENLHLTIDASTLKTMKEVEDLFVNIQQVARKGKAS